MHCFKTSFALAVIGTLAASAFAQQPETIKVEAKGGQAIAGVRIEQDPKFVAVAQRFQSDFGVAIKLARSDDPVVAKGHVVSALKMEHLENALQILTGWRPS